IDFDDDDDDEPLPLEAPPHSPHRAPTVPGPQVGRSNGGRGAGASSRRPQASTSPRSSSRTTPPSQRRAASSDFDIDTDVHAVKEPGAIEVPVDDDQLIDWSSSEETVTSGADLDRKR
ncbi:MAG: hypothetical protein KC464_12285, partial [Myxococcales bacterium]|nr:hypothetical protein [Myxococcales bacterium]